jgi:DtxR family Mn-dependent transcriptional regulator
MYLLRIALLSQDDDPVPISQLAETLGVSPISANQMCRKLEGKGMVIYQPYKGVTLTLQGEAIALRVLRKRRLWEVFLAEKLGLAPQQAEDIACRFEHVTPEEVTERLADYLGHPALSPQRQPIPPRVGGSPSLSARPLTALGVGQRARIDHIRADEALKTFLGQQRLAPGVEVKVLAAAGKRAMLLMAGEQHITLDYDIAETIEVIPLATSQPQAHHSSEKVIDLQ